MRKLKCRHTTSPQNLENCEIKLNIEKEEIKMHHPHVGTSLRQGSKIGKLDIKQIILRRRKLKCATASPRTKMRKTGKYNESFKKR